jgi:glycolate oxidase iron-sulfur subunit
MDSPRGRIYLMKEGLEGEPMDASMTRHLDQCLGCMACVTACPSGVQYDKLIEADRVADRAPVTRPRLEGLYRDMIYQLFPYPRRLKASAGPARLPGQRARPPARPQRPAVPLPEPLQAMESLAPKLGKAERIPERTPAVGTPRRTVGLLTGCVQGTFFPDVNAATGARARRRGLRGGRCRSARAAAARCRPTAGARTRRSASPSRSSRPSSAPVSTPSS